MNRPSPVKQEQVLERRERGFAPVHGQCSVQPLHTEMHLRSLLSAGVGLTGLALAQDTTRKTEESFIPSYVAANASYLWGSRADLKDYDGASMAQQEAGALAQYPVYQTERARLTVGLRYRWTRLEFEGVSPFRNQALDLHRVQIPLNYWRSLGEQWKLWAGVEPGFFTDFEAISDEDLAVTALAVVAYDWRPDWSVSFGAYYSRDLGEDRVLPVLGLIWRPNPHWNLAATFPRFRIAYAPSEDWILDLTVRPAARAGTSAATTAGTSTSNTRVGGRRSGSNDCSRRICWANYASRV